MEEWREIEGYEGVYSVSNLGRVRRDLAGVGSRGARILRPGRQKNGSRNVVLSRDSRPESRLVHRLVAAAFLPPPTATRNKIEHIDGDRSNNRADNLRWQTASEVSFGQVLRGTQKGQHHGRPSALTDAQVLAIRADKRTEKQVAREYGLAPGTVGQIRRRKTHTHLPPQEGDYQPADSLLRLTDAQVRAIRSDARGNAAVAAELGCTAMTVWCIRTGRAYAHVTDAPAPPPSPPHVVKPTTPPDANVYEVDGDVAAVVLAGNRRGLLDIADLARVRHYRWFARKAKSTYYVTTRVRTADGRVCGLDMHRLLMNPPDGLVVDHISTDGLDNRRANLRLATTAQNNLNSRVRRDCVSGLKGAFYDKRSDTYYSRIKVDGCYKWLGSFATAEEAAEAYAKASAMYHGEFGRSYLHDK